MALYKSAQSVDNFGSEDEVVVYDEKPSKDDVIEMHAPDKDVVEITFKLPPLPGSEADVPIEVSTDDPVEVVEVEPKASKEVEVNDPWDWQSCGMENVLQWVRDRFSNIPKHSGKETSGIERAISYLKRLNNEMSKAASNDFDGKIDISKFEEARKEIYSAIERLEDAKEKIESNFKRKKSANGELEMVKEGQKSTHVGGIIITVPLLISRVARVCINGTVSAGKDIEDLFDRQVKKYNLSDREQAETMQLLADMGYPLRRDRGFLIDEKVDPKSEDNFDWMPNYPA